MNGRSAKVFVVDDDVTVCVALSRLIRTAGLHVETFGTAAECLSADRLKDADCLVLVTEWNTFREPEFAKMRELMRSPVVFDGRNIYSPENMRTLGFTYFSIGR